MNISEEIKMQIAQLNMWTKAYDEGHPLVTDEAWDDAYFRLADLEKKTGIYFPNSPTQRINYEVKNNLTKVTHNHPMLSLDKTKEISAVENFVGNKDCIFMCKMDGLTCSLRYINGELVSAETRGNGVEGEDILHNARVIPSIPKKIKYKNELIVDGEIICDYKSFEQFKNEYKHPRNFAAGSIRLLDNKECAARNLTFVAWDIIKGFDEIQSENHNDFYLETLSQKLLKLRDYNFTVVPFMTSDEDKIENIINFLQKIVTNPAYMYPIDGIVIKYDDIEYYKSLGNTDHHFRGGLAYKFYDEEYETRLKDIEWSAGRTGVLTPVAIFEPVEIDGTQVERASLHNYSVMKEIMGDCCYCGQKIKVFKSNMIIPQIKSAEKMSYADVIIHGGITCDGFSNDFGLTCPICEGATEVRNNDGVETVWCTNPNCEGKIINRLDHFLGKKGLDIHGISKATLERLLDQGWINSERDIFTLFKHEKEWKTLSGFGEMSVRNILKSIEEGKNCTLESVISGAGIPLIGRTVARILAKEFKTYSEFRKAIREFDFSNLDGFGYEMNKALKNFDYTELDFIVENYLTIEEVKEKDETAAAVAGKNFVITGKSTLGSRDKVKEIIENAGGKVTGSVTSKTDYLVANKEENTAKYNNALKLGIPILNDEELMILLGKSN